MLFFIRDLILIIKTNPSINKINVQTCILNYKPSYLC